MSLLLEALKKAERAKEEAQRRANGLAAEPDPEGATAQPAGRPLMTRDNLPKISSTLEIVSDEPRPAPEPALEPPLPEPKPRPRPQSAAASAASEPRAADAQGAERATARKVFEAKFREPNPRLPFFIAMGGLGAFALGTVIYFYLQLRPPPSLVNLNPPRQAEEAVAAAPSAPASGPIASGAPAASGIPGLPGGPAATAPAAQAPAAPRQQVPAVPPPARAVPRAEAPVRDQTRAEPRAETPAIRPRAQPAQVELAPRAAPAVHPRIDAGYAAYQAGDLAAARREYQQALQDDPASRDALLGSAALDVRAGRYESAEATYLRLLQADPRDAHAQAALVALRSGRQDPLAAESRVKSLLAADPGAHVLNFALGNQFAQQGRWAEAQQQYFKAAAAEPDNADFAYNLAVSLDHLRQPRLALENYRRALALAEKRGASFDLAAARSRAAELGK